MDPPIRLALCRCEEGGYPHRSRLETLDSAHCLEDDKENPHLVVQAARPQARTYMHSNSVPYREHQYGYTQDKVQSGYAKRVGLDRYVRIA